jgi:coproporphyrinogen III oxidase
LVCFKDIKHFHRTLKEACDKHDKSNYKNFKKWCDEYFLIKHRNETRGVGGIFFDDYDKPNQAKAFEFVKSCGNSVVPSYLPIIKKNKDKGYGLKER